MTALKKRLRPANGTLVFMDITAERKRNSAGCSASEGDVRRMVAAGDFEGMARAQLAERKAFFYPPYARLTSLTLRHRDPSVLRNGVMDLAARLRTRFGRRLLGPMTPPVDRIRGEYLVGLLLKIESGASSARARELLTAELKTFAGNPAFKSITVVVNVDPQ